MSFPFCWKPASASFRQPTKRSSVADFVEKNQGVLAIVGGAASCAAVGFQVRGYLSDLQVAQVQLRADAEITAAKLRADSDIQAAKLRQEQAKLRADSEIQAAKLRLEQAKNLVDIVFHADYEKYRDTVVRDFEAKKRM